MNMIAMTRPYQDAVAVTPDDTNGLTTPSNALMATASGNIVAVMLSGSTVTLALTAGTVYPLMVKQIKATGTTATGIIALY